MGIYNICLSPSYHWELLQLVHLTPVRKQKKADRPNDNATCMIYKAQMADIPF